MRVSAPVWEFVDGWAYLGEFLFPAYFDDPYRSHRFRVAERWGLAILASVLALTGLAVVVCVFGCLIAKIVTTN